MLLDVGAEAKVAGKLGRNALSLAEKRGRKDVAKLFIESGAEEKPAPIQYNNRGGCLDLSR
jgi:hypothetical protein